MSYYKCINCNYNSNIFTDIKRHIIAKKSCLKNLDEKLGLTKDQVLIMSLLPYDENNHQKINKDDLKNYKNIYINKRLLINSLSENDKNKKKICNFCSMSFNKIQELREHIILDCFEKQIIKKEFQTEVDNINKQSNLKNNIINNSVNNSINNTINNTTVNNTTLNNITLNNYNYNTTNITLNIQTPISFDKSWDVSDIDEFGKKCEILCSDIMYTSLLQKILDNSNNLNVIIDKQKNIGFVYKNENEKYVEMKPNDIAENSMEKLHNNLIELNNNIHDKNCFFSSQIKFNEERIKKKLLDYKEMNDTKQKVNEYITEMFDKKKKESYEISKNIDDKLLELGY
jgi:hypothetical protein